MHSHLDKIVWIHVFPVFNFTPHWLKIRKKCQTRPTAHPMFLTRRVDITIMTVTASWPITARQFGRMLTNRRP